MTKKVPIGIIMLLIVMLLVIFQQMSVIAPFGAKKMVG